MCSSGLSFIGGSNGPWGIRNDLKTTEIDSAFSETLNEMEHFLGAEPFFGGRHPSLVNLISIW